MHYILTDIDDSILNFSDPMQAFLATIGLLIPQRMRDYHDIPGLFGLSIPETIEYVCEFHRSPGMGHLLAEPCAQVVLPELYRRGYRFVAISACLDEPEVLARRISNLEEAFGFKWEAVHCIGLSLDKGPALRGYPSSIWVEDMWQHAVIGAEIGHRSFIIDRPYNRGKEHDGVTRVDDWHDIARLLDD